MELGCPIFGDPKYGAELREQHQGKHAQLMQVFDFSGYLHLHNRSATHDIGLLYFRVNFNINLTD